MDWTIFDLLDEFTFTEAAYLWLEKEPEYTSNHPGKVIALSNALYAAYERGELKARDTSYCEEYEGTWRTHKIYVAGELKVKRRHLIEWTEHKGQRPLFLYPEDRKPAQNLKTNAIALGERIAEAVRSAAGSVAEKARNNLTHTEALQIDSTVPALPAPVLEEKPAVKKNKADWRVDEIIKALTARQLDLQALPVGTKKSICEELCKLHPGKFSDLKGGTFDKAWQAGVNAGSFRITGHDTFSGKVK